MLFQAFITFTIEKDCMGIDSARRRFSKKLRVFTDKLLWKIIDCLTCLTDKMVMWLGRVVEMFGAIPAGKAGDLSKLGQKLQIPVYGS